jgi:hypothetical protein
MKTPPLGALALLLAAGCGGGANAPDTYAVTGQVTGADGRPLPGGLVEFRHVERPNDPAWRAVGTINPEGNYKLKTLWEGKELTGCREGKYTVTVTPRGDDGQMPPPPVTLAGAVEVKPEDNVIPLTLPKK